MTRRMVTLEQLLESARARLHRLEPAEALAAMATGAHLIDIRGDKQIAADGRIPGALVIARNVLEWRLAPDSRWRHPDAPAPMEHIIILCDEGYQSSLASAVLQDLGLPRTTDIVGGFQRWRAERLPVIMATEVDRNRTRQTEMLGLNSFEDRGGHQATHTSESLTF